MIMKTLKTLFTLSIFLICLNTNAQSIDNKGTLVMKGEKIKHILNYNTDPYVEEVKWELYLNGGNFHMYVYDPNKVIVIPSVYTIVDEYMISNQMFTIKSNEWAKARLTLDKEIPAVCIDAIEGRSNVYLYY